MNEETPFYEGHGENWHAIIRDFKGEDIPALILETNQSPDKLIKKTDDYTGAIVFKPPVRTIKISCEDQNKEFKVRTIYPFFQIKNPVKINIETIYEWKTECEAMIIGNANGIPIEFFDAMYFYNKHRYEINKTYTFHLSALALAFDERTQDLDIKMTDGPDKGKVYDSRGMTGLFPNDKVKSYFGIFSPFHGFKGEYEMLGMKFYQYDYFLLSGVGKRHILEFPIFVPETALKNYTPKRNDPIVAQIWLQGYLAKSI